MEDEEATARIGNEVTGWTCVVMSSKSWQITPPNMYF